MNHERCDCHDCTQYRSALALGNPIGMQNQIRRPPICYTHNKEMQLTFWDRPGSPPGNGWACISCITERKANQPQLP